MNNCFSEKFEDSVLSALQKLICSDSGCDVLPEKLRLGIAVSGGADSISQLVALWNIVVKKNYSGWKLFVITVNHFIRPDEETCGDVEFVRRLCDDLNSSKAGTVGSCNVVFEVAELSRGRVREVAGERGEGVEEAARFLRYEAFDNFIAKYNLDYLCLAHNKNDQLETLLMRFIQGSGLEGAAGINQQRGKYIRPLLDIYRSDIENYLTERGIGWRTDSTNADTNYLRNKIRHKLVPFLNENFNGWQKSVLSGGKKAEFDIELLQDEVDEAMNFAGCYTKTLEALDGQETFLCDADCFAKLKIAVKWRLFVRMCNKVADAGRIPGAFIMDVISAVGRGICFTKYFGGLEVGVKRTGNKRELFVKKSCKKQTDLVFFDIIEEDGNYDFPFGQISVKTKDCFIEIGCNGNLVELKLNMPFCIRNWQLDDEVKCCDGNYKSVSDVFSDWHVEKEKRCFIPLVQELNSEKQEILCIFGKAFGFNNWVVNEKGCN